MTNPITQWNRMASANSVERQVADRAEKADKAPDAMAAAATRAPAPAADDKLELSQAARLSAQEPTFDRAKVDAIKQQVEQGQYPLDPRRIAENFLALEQMIRE